MGNFQLWAGWGPGVRGLGPEEKGWGLERGSDGLEGCGVCGGGWGPGGIGDRDGQTFERLDVHSDS